MVGGAANGVFMKPLASDLNPEEEEETLTRPRSALRHVVPVLAY